MARRGCRAANARCAAGSDCAIAPRETGYACGMSDFSEWHGAAYKSERVRARRLALRRGLSEEVALRQTLEQSAGAAGLTVLLEQRLALQAAERRRVALREAQKQAALALRRARHDGAPSAWRGWFDGSAHPNPGRCGIGARLQGPRGELVELSQAAGYGNSSEAEYKALIALLEAALGNDAHDLTIYGDSRVVIDDVTASAPTPAASLQPYRLAAQALLAQLHGVTLRWIPRHKNGAADALSQRAAGLHQDLE
jgi:ribonuclease HI